MVNTLLLLWGLIPPLLWAISNLVDKIATDDLSLTPVTVVIVASAISGFLALPVSLFSEIYSPILTILMMLTGAGFATGLILHMKAIQQGNVSRVSAIYETSPVMVAVLEAVFLGTVLNGANYLGVLAASGGAALSHFEFSEGSGLGPEQLTPFIMAMLASLIWSLQAVLTKWFLRTVSFIDVFFWTRFGGLLVAIVALFHPSIRHRVLKVTKNKVERGLVFTREALNTGAILGNTYALTLGSAAVVTTIGSAQPLIVLILLLFLRKFFSKNYGDDLSKSGLAIKTFSSLLLISGVYLALL